MTLFHFSGNFRKTVLLCALALSFGVATNTPVLAQHDHHDQNDQNRRDGYNNSNYQIAYDNGYRSGVQHGLEHRNQGHKYSYEDAEHYRQGTEGYRREYGSKDEYKRIFREGFQRGYDEGYRGIQNQRRGRGHRNSNQTGCGEGGR